MRRQPREFPLSNARDEHEDDPQLRSLRTAWRSLPDEDPPERGLAELMAAARHQADRRSVTASWWRRLLTAMTRPPMLALASVVVLLGGLFAVTRSRDGSSGVGAEPTPDQTTAQGSAASSIGTLAPPEPTAQGSAASSIGTLAPPEPTGAAAPAPVPDPSSSVASPAVPPAAVSRPQKRHTTPTTPAPAAHRATTTATSPRELEDDSAPAPEPQNAAPAAPPPPAPGGAPGGAAQGVAQQLGRLRRAVLGGDCASARSLAQEIASADPAYYRAHVVGDATLAPCLAR